MGADSRKELKRAILAVLKTDATLTAMGLPPLASRIYQRPRKPVTFPYVSVGRGTMTPLDTKDSRGAEVTFQIDTWSRSGGSVEAEDIGARIYELLHEQPLTLATQHFIEGRLQLSMTMDDPDGETTHGVQRFTFLTSE